jgi:redox-sensitive bicupin YhaK (pirin superfamily)
VLLKAGSTLRLPAEYDERPAFVVEGSVQLGEGARRAGEIGFLRRGAEVSLDAEGPCRLLLLGGPRFISWNFVSSLKERLPQAASDWHHQRFDRVPGETAYIPLPEDGEGPVNYP